MECCVKCKADTRGRCRRLALLPALTPACVVVGSGIVRRSRTGRGHGGMRTGGVAEAEADGDRPRADSEAASGVAMVEASWAILDAMLDALPSPLDWWRG